MTERSELSTLPLAGLHAEWGAKFVPFAGWSMPVQYAKGVMAEHLWCREKAGLFDVSHMGQVRLPAGADAALETLVPADVLDLPAGRQRYGLFTNDAGGVLDDLMIARHNFGLLLVVNAARAAADIDHLKAHIKGVAPLAERALLALQGPMAASVLGSLIPAAPDMRFMDVAAMAWDGAELWLSRSGYTGEDGFEISVPMAKASDFAQALMADPRVAPIGLGARDSLRLEAGLPLYGQDLSTEITPVEAGLNWAISKARRRGGARPGGFPGADTILDQVLFGAPRRRVGLRPQGRAPMRAGTVLFDDAAGGQEIGQVTSGGFGPSVGAPIALGLVESNVTSDTLIWGEVRGNRLPVDEVRPPFVTKDYKR
ncbi:MAG: glycine cleavage system aminomethyltransferase GcvT [Pseudomonadota bacterium]